MSIPSPRPVRYVIFHRPGPKWQNGIDFREQDSVGQNVQHYLQLHEQGKLELGGPFLLQDELEAFAASDPAVQSGLLVYEIRPWLTAMEHQWRTP